MDNIPTAEEFLCIKGVNDSDMILSTTIDDVTKTMIEFAKLHVEAALKAAADKAECEEGAIVDLGFEIISAGVNEESILNAYPLDLIK
jgi:hypothetical protein